MSAVLYNLRLVGKSLRRDRWFTIVMVVSQALGVSLFVTALTTVRRHSHMAGQVQPDVYRVEGEETPELNEMYRGSQFEGYATFGSSVLSLPTANALAATGGPIEQTVTFISVLAGGPVGQPPERLPVRFCDADLFSLFNVDFRYGGPWHRADEAPAAARVVVLTDLLNQQLYGGADSVGRMLRIDGADYRIVGVARQRAGKVHMWDFRVSPENIAHAIVPRALADELKPVPYLTWPSAVSPEGWAATARDPRIGFVEYWVRLPTAEARQRFAAAAAALTPRARLTSGDAIVARYGHAPAPYRVFLIFTLILMEANVVNVMRMLLAKASARAAEIGIHRALGAGRLTIFGRQLCEGVVVSMAGSVLGLALAIPTVATFDRLVPDSPVKLALTPQVVATTLIVCLLAGLVSGIYPAWRVGSEPPTRYLGKI